MSGVVDWGLGERAAATVIAGLPGRGAAAPDPAAYRAAEVEAACADAIATAAAYAGLGVVEDPPAPELIDRRA